MSFKIKTLVLSLGIALTGWIQASQASSLYFSGPYLVDPLNVLSPVNVGDTFKIDILGDFSAEEPLAGGIIDLKYNGDKLQIDSVTIGPVWDFYPRSGSQTATGTNSNWKGIGFDVWDSPYQSGNGILIATVNLTALGDGKPKLEFLGSTEVFDTTMLLAPTLIATEITVAAPAAVPVPPAVWLFATGLLGLVGVARRKG